MNNATQQFAAEIETMRQYAQQLLNMANDHMNVSPDNVTWGNVGDVARINKIMREEVLTK